MAANFLAPQVAGAVVGGYPIAVAMEGYNCHVRPLDSLVKARGWRLFNVNNLKLARFKEIFPAAAKSDRIDSAKTLELFQLRDHRVPRTHRQRWRCGTVREMREGPSEPAIRCRLQTTASCCR